MGQQAPQSKQQPPQPQTQCITAYDNGQFCFGGDGTVTFKKDTKIIDPNTVGVCDKYNCKPIDQLYGYATQMDAKVFNKYVHDNVCPVPGVDLYTQEQLKLITSTKPPTSWDQDTGFSRDAMTYQLLNTIKQQCGQLK